MEHQPRAAKRKFGFEGEDDKTTSIRRIKSCSPLTSTILEETGDEAGRDDTESFTKSFTEEQQKFLLKLSVARSLDESLGWWEIFDLFTSLHPWHPFTQAEMRQECLDLEFRAKQNQPPDFELHGDFDSLFPLPQLKTKGEGDRVRPQALAPPSFTSEYNERIIHLAHKPQKNDRGWEEFYNTISTKFPSLTEKEVRQQYLHLRMQRNYDIGVKLLSTYDRVSFSKEMRELSPITQELRLWSKVFSEMRESIPDLQDTEWKLKHRFRILERYVDKSSEFTNAAERDIVCLCQELESGGKIGQWEVVLEEFKSRNKGYDWCNVEDLQLHYLHLMNEARLAAKDKAESS